MDLKEIKKIAKLFNMMSEYGSASEIVDYMKNDCGFTEAQIIKLVQDIQNSINLFSFELIRTTVKPDHKV